MQDGSKQRKSKRNLSEDIETKIMKRIKELRIEIKKLKYKRNAVQRKIDQKQDVLKELEKLTVNQIDMFQDEKNL